MSSLKDRLALAMKGPPKVSQADLARACGIKAPSVSDWISGKTKTLEGANLVNAAVRLGVNPQWLASGKGPMRSLGVREPVTEFLGASQSAGRPPSKMDLALLVARAWIAAGQLPGSVEDHGWLVEKAYLVLEEVEETDPARIVVRALEQLSKRLATEKADGN